MALGGVLILVVAATGLAGSVQLSRAYDAAYAGDYTVARQRAVNAARLAPWASDPWRIAAYADGNLGNAGQSRSDAKSGLSRAPGDWWFWFRLACLNKDGARQAGLARARSLNPRVTKFASAPSTVNGRPEKFSAS